jgi:hypothetical protein
MHGTVAVDVVVVVGSTVVVLSTVAVVVAEVVSVVVVQVVCKQSVPEWPKVVKKSCTLRWPNESPTLSGCEHDV